MIKRLIGWIIDNYYPDEWVEREKHVQVVASCVALANSTAPARWQAINDDLRRQNQKLICDGLHRYGFLPKDADPRGTLEVKTSVKMQQRDRFKVTAEIEDVSIGYSEQGLRAVVFEQLATLIAGILKDKLIDRFKVAEEDATSEEDGKCSACGSLLLQNSKECSNPGCVRY